jgi:GNAT superfamily N-acetyltransferase
MSLVTTRPCTVAEVQKAPNIAALLEEYGAESSIGGIGPQSAQFETYAQWEAIGILRMLGAFRQDELVGLVIVLCSVLPHYGKKVATTESFFVTQSARKSGVGLRLLREAERVARDWGAVGFLVSAPVGGQLEKVLPCAGYVNTNHVFFKGLA